MNPRTLSIMFLVRAIVLAVTSAHAEPIRCIGHAGVVFSVAFSPDGQTVVSGGIDRMVRVWTAADGKQLEELPIYDQSEQRPLVFSVAFSPDGKSVAAGARGVPVTFWDTASWKKEPKTLPVDQTACGICYSPDGSLLAFGEPQEVKIWDLNTLQLAHRFKVNIDSTGMPMKLAFSPDGSLLAATSVIVWKLASGNEAFKLTNVGVESLAFSPDGKLLVTAGHFHPKAVFDVWKMSDQKKTLSHMEPEQRIFRCVAFSPNGKILATGGAPNGVIELWDTETGKLISKLEGQSDQVRDLCFSSDGSRLASAGYDKLVLIWTLKSDMTNHSEN